MTEAEWLGCANPGPMLDYLRGRASERKLRLFAVACCRRIGHWIRDERSQWAGQVAQLVADGAAPREQLDSCRAAALAAIQEAESQADIAARFPELAYWNDWEEERAWDSARNASSQAAVETVRDLAHEAAAGAARQ